MIEFEAEMQFDNASVRALAKAQVNVFKARRQAALLTAAAAALYSGLFLIKNPGFALLFTAAGCFLFVFQRYPEMQQLRQFHKAFPVESPSVRYRFYQDALLVSGVGERRWKYSQIRRLLYAQRYFYLLTAENTLLMLAKGSLRDSYAFQRFLEDKTGLTWMRLVGSVQLPPFGQKWRMTG